MGADCEQVVVTVEDSFGIRLADEEIERVATVGQLHDLIWAKLEAPRSGKCLTSAAFYRLRRTLIDILGVERSRVRPETPISELVPAFDRRAAWRRIQPALALKLPDLEYPRSVVVAFIATGATVASVWALSGRAAWGALPAAVLAAFVGVILGGLLLRCVPMLAVSLPASTSTVGDLVRNIVALNHARLASSIRGFSEAEVWESLCRIIALHAGIEPSLIRRDISIVDDLGID